MLYLSEIRDWLKNFNAADNYYIGKLDNKKDKSIGVYQRNARPPNKFIGQPLSYEVKQISLLIHWNKNAAETERAAYSLYEKIIAEKRPFIGEKQIYMIDMLNSEPIDISTDDCGVYERVIEFDIYYERSNK